MRISDWSSDVCSSDLLFYDDYKNTQRFVNLNTTPASTVTRIAAAGTITGLDLDLVAKPVKRFEVAVKYNSLDAEYDIYPDPTLGDMSNSRFANSPKQQPNITTRKSGKPVERENGGQKV